MSRRDGSNRLHNKKSSALTVFDFSGNEETMIISPGWVDIHTHLDQQVTWDALVTPLSAGGVTTAILGSSEIDSSPVDRKLHSRGTFSEYLNLLRSKSFAMDIGALVSYESVRACILEKRADPPTDWGNTSLNREETEHMTKLVSEAISLGAMGLSISGALERQNVDVPGSPASDDELEIIGKAVGEVGNGKAVVEIASNFTTDSSPR